MKKKSFLLTVAILIIAISSLAQVTSTFTDSRDGKIYKTVTIGTQTWMAENVNYETTNSWCNICETYGRLYSYEAAINACPKGWHLPSDNEWTTLINYIGGDSIAGGKMKSTSLWNNPNFGATNSTGFSAYPAGLYPGVGGIFYFINAFGFYWSATESDSTNAWSIYLSYDDATVVRKSNLKTLFYSIRCMKD
jgi:uncharacterized protein (TIGR02145 family)